jgi:3-phytase
MLMVMPNFKLAATALAVCSIVPMQSASARTAEITAQAETEPVGRPNRDTADDPAIWRNAGDPLKSLIVATDKKEGLNVFGLDGKRRHFAPAGRINNVDLVDMGHRGVLVVASDRNDKSDARLRIYRLLTDTAKLQLLGVVDDGEGEAYGLCAMRMEDELHAFSIRKDGEIRQTRIDLSGNTPSGETVRTMRVASKSEGCVVDERTFTLYVGEQDHAIWAFDARPEGAPEGRRVADVDEEFLDSDVEGLAIAPVGKDGGWLVASSQGDDAYAIYNLPDFTPAGRFRIVEGAVGSTEHTDGIDLVLGSFGSDYPDGLFVAQDGKNKPNAQNFKLARYCMRCPRMQWKRRSRARCFLRHQDQ